MNLTYLHTEVICSFQNKYLESFSNIMHTYKKTRYNIIINNNCLPFNVTIACK